MTPAENDRHQSEHDRLRQSDPGHDDCSCWCCCRDCAAIRLDTHVLAEREA